MLKGRPRQRLPSSQGALDAASKVWEPVDPVVTDPVDKITTREAIYTIYIYTHTRNFPIKVHGGRGQNFPILSLSCHYLVVILSNWVPDNWVYRFPRSTFSTVGDRSATTLEQSRCCTSPTKQSTKTPQKIRGKFGAKFGAKFGTKIRKIQGTFVLQQESRLLLPIFPKR